MPATVPNAQGMRALRTLARAPYATPTLATLTLSGSLQIGTAASGTIIGATSGSTIVGNIPGVVVNGPNRTYSGTPTGPAGPIANALVETLAGAVGSPKSSSITVNAATLAKAFTNRLNLMGYNGYAGSDGTDTDSNCRVYCYNNSGAIVTKFIANFAGWYATGTNESNGYNTVTITASIEYPAGTFTQILFGGSPSYSLLATETKSADEVTPSVPIPAGAQFWIRTYVSVTAGQKWVQGFAVNTTKGEAFDFSTGVDKTLSGTITNATATATRRGFGPISLKATAYGAGTVVGRSWASVGDSILARAGAANNDSEGNFGWNDRAIYAAGFPHLVYAISGTTAFGNIPASFTRRLGALQAAGITDILIDWANNDLSGSQTYAQITANITSIVNSLTAAGFRVHYVIPFPRVSGTFLTSAGQTFYAPNGNYLTGPTSVRAQVADWVRSNVIGLTGVVDVGTAIDVNSLNALTTNGGIWISGNAGVGASNTHLTTTGATTDNATGDGQHPSDNFSAGTYYGGHWICQDVLAAYLAALPVL